MRKRLSRRTFAATAASTIAVPLAGCQSGGNGEAGADEASIEYDSDASVALEEPSDGATAANGDRKSVV